MQVYPYTLISMPSDSNVHQDRDVLSSKNLHKASISQKNKSKALLNFIPP